LYERPIFGREFRIPIDLRTHAFIYLGTIAIIAGYFGKSLGYGGELNVEGKLSVASALLGWLFAPLAALAAAVFLATRRGISKLLTGICTLILFALMMTVGRRFLVYTAIDALFALRLTGYRLKGTIFRRILLLSVFGLFMAFGVTVVMLLRLAASAHHHNLHTPLAERIQTAITWVEDGTALTRATEANRTNVQKRTFVLGFFADVLEGSSRNTPALGRDLMGQGGVAVPRLLNPDKDLSFGEETLDDELFNLSYTDGANSILTGGATDFGILGAIAYPLLLVWLLRFSIEISAKFLPAIGGSFIVLGVVSTLLATEIGLLGYFVAIRNQIIIVFILFIFFHLPGMRVQNQ
jgi:hypothetical protein